MNNPRVLFLMPFPPPVHGSSIVSYNISKSSIINQTFDCTYVNISTSVSMSQIGKYGISKFFRYLSIFVKLLKKLLTKKYDLCYCAITCHGKGFIKDSVFVLICKLFGCKIIIHQHNKGMSKNYDNFFYQCLLKTVYKGVIVILLSWRLYDDISKVVSKEQVRICPNGVASISGTSKFLSKSAVPNIIFLSNLIESKGVYDLLEACKILKDNGTQFECTYVGNSTADITKEKFDSQILRLGLSEHVKYLGPRFGDEKIDLLLRSDIFVFPTFYNNECFPVVILEAMQCGLPIVTTDEGAILDIVINDYNGLICKKNNPNSIAESLEVLLSDKCLRNQMGAKSYDLYSKYYTLEIFETTLQKIISEVVS